MQLSQNDNMITVQYLSRALMVRVAGGSLLVATQARAEYFNEPLDPANLDRFALQIATDGLVHGHEWDDAARVVSQNLTTSTTSGEPPPSSPSPSAAAAMGSSAPGRAEAVSSGDDGAAVDLASVHAALPWVTLPRFVIGGLMELLRRLVEEHGCTEKNAMLSDRTLLVKAPRILQANALLAGRRCVLPSDLRVLQLMTTFRTPPGVHQNMDGIIDGVVCALEAVDKR
eukprot:COSAG01_NODE_4348_length_5116_cov_1.582220_5_plen_228_part_00